MFGRLRWLLPTALLIGAPLLLLGWTAIAAEADASPSPSGAASGPALQGDPSKGQTLFGNNGCATCHGANLEGGIGPKLNPIQKLKGVDNPKDPSFLTTTIKQGRPGQPDGFGASMPAFPQLSEQDLNNLAAYILAQNQKGSAGLGPVELARSNVFWVSVGIGVLCLLTYLLSLYNMRWIDRRVRARQERGRL